MAGEWLPYWHPCPRCQRWSAGVRRPFLDGVLLVTRWWDVSCPMCGLEFIVTFIRPSGFNPPVLPQVILCDCYRDRLSV